MFPAYWKSFVSKNNLEEATCLIVDGTNSNYLYLLPEKKAIEEARELYPGKDVCSDGYIPVAACEEGTGNIYCIKKSEGKFGALYLVLLNCGDTEQNIRTIFGNYEMLLPFVCR